MSKKLLLADDSITIQKVIQITFAHEDYELTITDNGDAALAKALEIKPDLIMADVYMPGKNGYELTSAIKQHPALQHVPVLLLAGSFEPFDEDKARSCKADAWIEKPFESQRLIDKVAELLSAAPKAPDAPLPSAEQPPVFAATEPVVAAEVEEVPFLAAFDETVSDEPQMAEAAEDPFGDISFEEEELPVAQPAPVIAAADDDWSDFVDVTEKTETVADAFAVAEESAVEVEDFSFAEEVPEAVVFAPQENAPVAEADFDVFDMEDDEIMPLGDDDILGAEDLEPIMPEQTLAAWSRVESGDEDVFEEPLAELTAEDLESTFSRTVEPAFVEETSAFVEETSAFVEETSAFVEETSAFVDETPAFVDEVSSFSESAVEPSAPVEPMAFAVETAPVAAVAMVDAEAKASAMSEEEIEKIIEKIVSKVVEKLAVSILERVAWEVVPDLAESLIREEIRKIKDAAA